MHAVVVLSNHYHIICTDAKGTLPVFTRELNRLVARCLNAYLARSESFWATSVQPSYVLLADEEAILAKTVYALVNPVAAGLVKSGADWPGELLFRPGRYLAKRPDFFFREQGAALPESLELELVPPPIGKDAQAAIEMVQDAVNTEERLLRARFKREGKSFLGATRVRSQQTTESPKTAAPRRKLSPKFACKDESRRLELIGWFKAFVQEYRAARKQWLSGIRTVLFPWGTYAMRVHHRVLCAET